jgi:hypothetical protein
MAEEYIIMAESLARAQQIALERAETHKKTAFYEAYSGSTEYKYEDFESRIITNSKVPSLYTAYYLNSGKDSQLLFVITIPVEMDTSGNYRIMTYYDREAETFMRAQSSV